MSTPPQNEVLIGDCADVLKEFDDESIDLICTDPPYGISFMGKEWDRALPSSDALKECCRVLKAGAFGFFMCAPRQDVLSRMIIRLEDAGFKTGFTSIYWTYSQGFPKASAIDKFIDKRNGRYPDEYKELGVYLKSQRELKGIPQKDIASHFPSKTGGLTGCVSNWELGSNVPTISQWGILKELLDLDSRFDELIEREEAEREVIGKDGRKANYSCFRNVPTQEWDLTVPATPQAKQFDGSYAGFQPKPATEVIIVCMKPLSEKTYVDQALKNGKGVTWLDDCRIPLENDDSIHAKNPHTHREYSKNYTEIYGEYQQSDYTVPNGRFPANLLVSDDVLNNGIITKSNSSGKVDPHGFKKYKEQDGNERKTFCTQEYTPIHDSGSFSRYFSLDAWWDHKIQDLPEHIQKTFPFLIVPKPSKSEKNKYIENKHPTVKPLKLMSYLITMGSREGDIILDPFAGSGTTLEACQLLNRRFIGIDKDPVNEPLMRARGQLDTIESY